MARSTEGRALTEWHRRQQITIGLDAELEARAQFDRLDVSALDRTTPAWLAATAGLLMSRRAQSSAAARSYVEEFREAEGEIPSPVVTADRGRRLIEGTLMLVGPIAIKRAISRGVSPAEAYGVARRAVTAQAPKLAMSGGRETVLGSARRRGSRWRRVTDADPCAFCGMLAGRGPVYSSETVLFPLHKGRCGCTAEEVFGVWQPTALEQAWDESYADAAGLLKQKYGPFYVLNDRAVTRVMRRMTPELFHDGIPGLSLAEIRAIA